VEEACRWLEHEGRLPADFSIRRPVMFFLGLCLRHVLALLGFAVPARAGAVVYARRGIHPDLYIGIAFVGLRSGGCRCGGRKVFSGDGFGGARLRTRIGITLRQQWQAYHHDEQRTSDSLHDRLSLVQKGTPEMLYKDC